MITFIWTAKLIDSATKHGVSTRQAEYIVRSARDWILMRRGQYRVVGQVSTGEYAEVFFAEVDDETWIDWEDANVADAGDEMYYIFHARFLLPREKAKLRRRRQ